MRAVTGDDVEVGVGDACGVLVGSGVWEGNGDGVGEVKLDRT